MKSQSFKHLSLVLAVSTLLTACLQTPPQNAAQNPPERTTAVYGSDFDRLVNGPFGSTQLDEDCAQPFDSANPFIMAVEMSAILQTPRLDDALSKLLKVSPESTSQQRQKQRELLKQTAKHKVWLPVAAETAIGQQLHQALVQQRVILPDEQLHPRDLARLRQIRQSVGRLVQALPANQPYTFQVHATRDRASALAAQMGGFVYVSEGLLRDRGLQDADIALRLSHEISHVTKRHVLRDFQTKAVDAFNLTNWTLQDLQRLNDGQAVLDLVRQRFSLMQALSKTFDHGNELEADSCAIGLLRQVLPQEDIRAAVDNFAQQSRGNAPISADQTTHPRSERRVLVMQRKLSR